MWSENVKSALTSDSIEWNVPSLQSWIMVDKEDHGVLTVLNPLLATKSLHPVKHQTAIAAPPYNLIFDVFINIIKLKHTRRRWTDMLDMRCLNKTWTCTLYLRKLISLRRPYHSIETLDAALQEVENIPAYLPNCLQLKDVFAKAKKWLHEAEALQVKYA